MHLSICVAPLVGAWIEIILWLPAFLTLQSLPSWERGLKFTQTAIDNVPIFVAPLVGAWIEIYLRVPVSVSVPRRSPRGSVD